VDSDRWHFQHWLQLNRAESDPSYCNNRGYSSVASTTTLRATSSRISGGIWGIRGLILILWMSATCLSLMEPPPPIASRFGFARHGVSEDHLVADGRVLFPLTPHQANPWSRPQSDHCTGTSPNESETARLQTRGESSSA